MKILIHNGLVIDPENLVCSKRSLYLENGKIAAVPAAEVQADLVIDAAGKIVCPGFIDIHMHEDPLTADGKLYSDDEKAILACMLRMGVTTAVGGNCGENYSHPADYMDLADRDGSYTNIAMLAGHKFFRHLAGCTEDYGPAAPEQIEKCAASIEDALLRGCAGVSYGIRYVPGMDMQELKATAAGAKKQGKMLAAHIRDDAAAVLSAAEEFLDAGVELGVPVQVSHVGSMAGFGQMEDFLSLIDKYRERNPRIFCDCYPYDAFSTGIGSATYDEGWLHRYNCSYEVLELAEGKYKGRRCTKEIFDEVRRDDPSCRTICYVMEQSQVDLCYTHPAVMPASDGILNAGAGHPRAAGTFPRFLSRYAKGGMMSMYEAVNRMTAMPAKQLGLKSKGNLSIGSDGDIVIFDPQFIEDRSTFNSPLSPPVGIDYVIVNGIPAVKDGRIINSRAGKSARVY